MKVTLEEFRNKFPVEERLNGLVQDTHYMVVVTMGKLSVILQLQPEFSPIKNEQPIINGIARFSVNGTSRLIGHVHHKNGVITNVYEYTPNSDTDTHNFIIDIDGNIILELID